LKKNFSMALFSPDADASYTDEAAFRTDGAVFEGRERMAVLSARKKLSGKTEITFFLTACFSEKQYLFLRKRCLSGEAFSENGMKREREVIEAESGHPLFDAVVNQWSLYQTLVSRVAARSGFYQVSGAYGFRDQLQDALALIPVFPWKAKALILRAAAHQYEQGDVQHWWHESEGTGIRTRCSDDFLWLPYVAQEYVRQTGDEEILSLSVPYLHSEPLFEGEHERYEKTEKSKLCEPLFSHLLRSVRNGRCVGTHGFPLIGTCDWNDGMNLVGARGKGESVWLAFFRILVLRKMKALCQRYGDLSPISEMELEEDSLCEALRRYGFDGAWYRRGYYDDGSVLGGKERKDCQIDLLPQAFSAMLAHESGFEKEKARKSMQSVYQYLFDAKHSLVKLLYPPFDKDAQTPGYIKGYVPGIRENGGQYTHAAVWAVLGFFLCGDYEKGTEILFAINPAERYQNPSLAEAYRIEPYVFAGDIYTNAQHIGRGGWSFYTGSAAWYRKVALEILYGYTQEKDGFYLKPRLSETFSSFKIRVEKNHTVYRISVSLADRSSLTLDGKEIREGENHFFRWDGTCHEAILKLKKE
jgi:cyclic beta-1,2-glucan synthetase